MRTIAVERARLRMSQRQLAETLGVAESTVRNWENGRREPGVFAVMAMARVFGCTIDYLCGLTEERVRA